MTHYADIDDCESRKRVKCQIIECIQSLDKKWPIRKVVDVVNWCLTESCLFPGNNLLEKQFFIRDCSNMYNACYFREFAKYNQ
jgi:hypothetical protein